MVAPYQLRDMTLKNRVMVSPMAQCKAVDGCPPDWDFIHYGERAKRRAGQVHTEMTWVSAPAWIMPGCPGLYAPGHEAAWTPLVDFVHQQTDANICYQLETAIWFLLGISIGQQTMPFRARLIALRWTRSRQSLLRPFRWLRSVALT